MNDKRSLELSDDTLDGVSGGMDITGINRADLKSLHSGTSVTPGASGITPEMSGRLKGPPATGQIGEITGGVQTRVAANIATFSEGAAACQTGHVEDVDIAKAMADYTKDNILQQSPQAMMAQETPPWSQYLG